LSQQDWRDVLVWDGLADADWPSVLDARLGPLAPELPLGAGTFDTVTRVAVVNVPHYEPWIVNRWAFRTLAECAETFAGDPDDRYVLTQAVALDGLHFNLLPPDQCARLALAVSRAADELRAEFRSRVTARDRTSPITSTRFGCRCRT
jgi:hypothetical protein